MTRRDALLTALSFSLAPPAKAPTKAQSSVGGTVTRYIDPAQQTGIGFGERSHWLQPWRAYEETPPASRLLNAVGINLNIDDAQAEAVCAHLRGHGFNKVRVEFGWGALSYEDPTRLKNRNQFENIVEACRRYAIRPLFLLNSHHGVPCPLQQFNVALRFPAAKGDRFVMLDPKDAARFVPGRSGLSDVSQFKAAEILFTRIEASGMAHLSHPLPKDLPANDAKIQVAQLKYLPFYPARHKGSGGKPIPEYEDTLRGWVDYVGVLAREAQRVLKTTNKPDAGFDLEVWNELTFGSDFLSINNYYEKGQEPVSDGEGNIATELVAATVAWVRDPRNNLPGVGISDGFNNQWPWGAGSSAVPGLSAIGKHPYNGARRFRTGDPAPTNGRPLDALGKPAGKQTAAGGFLDDFIPTYTVHFPEYGLNAHQTEHWVRDISLITTDLYGTKHGQLTHPFYPDGKPAPAPEFWITETNMDAGGADPGDMTAYLKAGKTPLAPTLTEADADHMKAKAILRYLVSYTGRGPVRFYFYAARDENPRGLGLVSRSFFEAVTANKNQPLPDDSLFTSPTLAAVSRLTDTLKDGGKISTPRALTVASISDKHDHRQFDGDPKTANLSPNPHPPLYNRECVAVFPFQLSDNRFAVAVYVMTRNITQLYRPAAPATDVTRFDMPPEMYQITLRGIRAGSKPRITLSDPLTGKTIANARVLKTGNGTLTVELPLTDSPRLLVVNDGV